MIDIHAAPKGLPPIPRGEIYLGKGAFDVPDRFEGHMYNEIRREWVCGLMHGDSGRHYTAPLNSPAARHILSRRVPDGVPELPEGYVYLGLGHGLPEGMNGPGTMALFKSMGGSVRWFSSGLDGEWELQNHYAAPIDSPIARQALGIDGADKPNCDDAPDWALWRAQDANEASEAVDDAMTNAIDEFPDLIIPSGLDFDIRFLREAREKGYRIEWDSSNGIRGWKE